MEYSTQVVQYVEINGFKYPRLIRKAQTSLRRKQSDLSLTGSSDQNKRESESVAYRDTRYTTLLEGKGIHMHDFDDDNIPKDMEDLLPDVAEKGANCSSGLLIFAKIYSRRLAGR